ncbi:hypothetical protein T8A63_15360 [Sulfitobacter sp. OXR-159]|uniref:hypothetical protein n=1 Tax=Sulfitobacter sp. OXR-159 TaxID=3100174 RepID=UPI002AC8C831|nr:hypothetical protein [Sulfitobacter sp. OXR-159]WPZ28991.1 hypothetical protein T8A63_15360 [Sulfitobacter sp. OXR-159]
MGPKEYRNEILEVLAQRFEENNNSRPDAYALILAIDVYASVVSYRLNGKDKDVGFKDGIEAYCEPFKIIRSASNAIKHIERKNPTFIVTSIDSVRPTERPGWHGYFGNGSGVSITVSWVHDPETDTYNDPTGKKLDYTPVSPWKTQYLRKLHRPAIEAIDAELIAGT